MSRLRVLIADDQPAFVQALRLLLSADDRIEIVGSARNGQQAVEMAAALSPDLVLMDHDMPVMDGVEATRIISERERVPVLLLTGSDPAAVVGHAQDAGASGYLPKGVDPSDLLERILALGSQARV